VKPFTDRRTAPP